MGFLKALQFIYGSFMGTTTEYLKPVRKHYDSVTCEQWTENIKLLYGGSGNQLIYENEDIVLVIDCGLQPSAFLPKNKEIYLIISSPSQHRLESWKSYSAKEYYAPIGNDTKELFTFARSLNSFSENRKLTDIVDVEIVKDSHSFQNVIIQFKQEKLIVLGELFYNKVHPEFRPDLGLNIKNWINNLSTIEQRFSEYHIYPGEGDLAGNEELKDFIDYLKAMSNEKLDFSYMRKHFDWKEVEAYTSLEDNFDTIRRIGPGIRINKD